MTDPRDVTRPYGRADPVPLPPDPRPIPPPVVVVASTITSAESQARELGLDPRSWVPVTSARDLRALARVPAGSQWLAADPLVRRASWWPRVRGALDAAGLVEQGNGRNAEGPARVDRSDSSAM